MLNNACDGCPGPNQDWGEIGEANSEHEPGVWEMRSVGVNGSSNQCVYDGNGNIMDKIEMINEQMSFSPGSADLAECPILRKCWRHTWHDYKTWLRAKYLDEIASKPEFESTRYRRMYYEVRAILVEKE